MVTQLAGVQTPKIGTPKPNGGRPITIEEKQRIFARREKAVELRAMGLSFESIADRLGVSWTLVRGDIERHLSYCAKYYNASKFREQIVAVHRATIRERYAMLDTMEGREDNESLTLKLKVLDSIDAAAAKMARLYNLVDGDTNVILGGVHVTTGEGLLGNSPEWSKDMDPERVKELREKIIGFYKAAHPTAALPAEFTVEDTEKAAETEVPVEPVKDGPVSMRAE